MPGQSEENEKMSADRQRGNMASVTSMKFVTLNEDGTRTFHACPVCSGHSWKTFHPSGKCPQVIEG
jgi:hypothetical protein